MFMARTLGRTIEELADSMSAAEYGDWLALYAIEREEREGRGAIAAGVTEEKEMDLREFIRRTER